MASYAAIRDVGKSLERALTAWFREVRPLGPTKQAKAHLARTEDFENKGAGIGVHTISVFLYRVDLNKVMRSAWSQVGHVDGRGHLALDLHFLLTPWGENAQDEHALLGAAMEFLEQTPIFTGPLLSGGSTWAPGEAIQFVLGEMTTEEVMRTFDSLPTEYRLSVPYLARVVRLDSRAVTPDPPVSKIVTGATPSVEV